jgi:hypothetical protein
VATSGPEPASLVGSWSHSHEEDAEGVQVFRPTDYEFPPSRGRTSFTLRPDGTAVAGLPGPDDRGISTDDGTWQLQGDVLHVRCPGWTATYVVVSAAPRRLELRPAR